MRREYLLKLGVNGRLFHRVIIDDHYEKKHGESLDDQVILELVKTLNGTDHPPVSQTQAGYLIFVTEPVRYEAKSYRLVWTYHRDKRYLGVINAFRVKGSRYGK